MGRSAAKSLYALSLAPERKVNCYNRYFVNGYVFHTEEYGHGRKTYNNGICVKGSTCSELEVDYYGRLEEVIELQYHSEHNRVFLFKCYWYDTTNKEIRVDHHYDLVEINSKARFHNVNNVFVIAKQCQHVYYTYTLSFRKDRSRVDWLSILKMKPGVVSRLFRMRTKTQVCEMKSFKLVSWLNDTTKSLMSSPKCRSVKVINNPARPGSNHKEVNCINYK